MDTALAAGIRELPGSTGATYLDADLKSVAGNLASSAVTSTGVSYFDANTGTFVKAAPSLAATAKKGQDEFLVVMNQGSNKPRHELYELTLATDKQVTSTPPLVQADEIENLVSRFKKMAARFIWKK
jgi:hypothetical protein